VVPLLGLIGRRRLDRGAVRSEAVALFFDRARTLDTQFDADRWSSANCAAELDGMPLAIEWPPPQRDARHRRTAGRSGRPAAAAQRRPERRPPARSLRTMPDWSHELLDDEERTALRRLGRFAGDVDLAAAAAIIDLASVHRG